MKRIFVTVLLAAVVSVCLSAGVSAQSGSLMKPSSINLPYGATIKTEINLTENDLLPTIKSLIPMIGELAKMGAVQEMGASMAPGVGEMGAQMMSGIDELDTTQLAAAVEGVKAVRLLIGTYPRNSSPKKFQMDFEKGLVKTGTFSKVLGNIQDTAVGVYSQSNNGGFVAYMYDPQQGTVAAGRLVGFLDIEKVMNWVMEMAKKSAEKAAPVPDAEPAPEPVPDSPSDEPAPTE